MSRGELSARLRALRIALRAVPIEFDPAKEHFVLRDPDNADGAPQSVPGLTGALRRAFPVPSGKLRRSRTAARRSRTDPVPNAAVWHAVSDSACALLRRAARSCAHAAINCELARLANSDGAAGFGPAFNKRHGIVVDEQLQYYATHGRAALFADQDALPEAKRVPLLRGGVDPCVATLIAYLDAKGLAAVAAQVPLYSPQMRLATAFDLLVTDRATRDEVHLVELKATATVRTDDASYVALRGRLRGTVARGTPLSYYSQHQLQLWTMHHMMRAAHGVAPDNAHVLRVCAGTVYAYALNEYYHERAAKLVPAIRRRGAPARKRKRGMTTGGLPKPQRARQPVARAPRR